MLEWKEIKKVMDCFPNSFINNNGELIIHEKSNTYFNIEVCEDITSIKCRMLEWLSKPAHDTCPYSSDRRNKGFHKFLLNGINNYLCTNFNEADMQIIYDYLGNACNHSKTIEFVNSNYDFNIIKPTVEVTNE